MLRFLLVPFVLLIILLLASILFWFLYKKIRRGIDVSVKKGVEIASEKQQKWTEKEQRKKQPKILQQGFRDYENIKHLVKSLPPTWKVSLDPIIVQAKEILDEVTLEFESNKNNKKSEHQSKKINSIRSFFNHSLSALLQFIEKLHSDHKKLSTVESDKAYQTITVFKADLLKHQEALQKLRRFDFDVVMDVIKARL